MSLQLHHGIQVATRGGTIVDRRDFFRVAACGLGATHALNWTDVIARGADDMRKRGMACILLWMQGGPSQFETFSPKPRHANGGEIEAISTAVPGIEVSANFPHCANEMKELAIVRSLTSKEGNHQRAAYLLHHGYLPMASVKHPTLGANVAHRLGNSTSQLPSYVRIGGRLQNAGGGGLLGVEYDPLLLASASQPPSNAKLLTSQARFERRRALAADLEREFALAGGAQVVENQQKTIANAAEMILSADMDAFEIERENNSVRAAYGPSEFGAGCLMARRLVERGVTFVEVSAGNWDTHQDNFERTRDLAAQVDLPMAQLIGDLRSRGMLERTLVVWMGEFGRTPRINPRGGRDHYPRAFNAVLAGGGVRGGQTIGATDASGSEVEDRPVTVSDLFRSIYHALGIDADHENLSAIGRPIKLVEGGEWVRELFS